ncbi:methylaspartate mutase [Chlorobium phaeovibrioides]|uniref:methylaspartate mutase n=1 Tax=Chlorobium phaeovibrioides TaxID=1094 RepID=UPI00163A8F6E|nr:methylaspartate mutase [Chlorobium phaeovibrioides]
MSVKLNEMVEDFSAKRALLRIHPLVRELPEDASALWLVKMPVECFAAVAYERRKHCPFLQPRGGFGLWDQQRELSLALAKAGADFLPLTIDSHTRHNDYDRALMLLRQSEETGENLLNGYPLLAHGATVTRSLYEGINIPVSLRHGTPDARLLVEVALDSGITEIEGGGLCYCLPYSRAYPVDRALLNWQYVDRLCAVLSTPERPIHRESFGPLTATMVPPFMVVAVEILELLLAAEQGVSSYAISFAQTGSLTQDLATARALRFCASHYLECYDLKNISVRLVFHQWMGAFPHERVHADALIVQGAVTAALAQADKVVVKTRTEALGIPDPQSNADAVGMSRYAMELCQGGDIIGNGSEIAEEAESIISAVDHLLGIVFECGGTALWDSVARAVRSGLIDIPFSPHQENANRMWTLRDADRSIRIADPGFVPLPQTFLNRERAKLAGRCSDKSLDRMLDDIMLMVRQGGGK